MEKKNTSQRIKDIIPLLSQEQLDYITKYRLPSFILIILYAVGVLSLVLNVHPKFIYLTPFNLLISFGAILYTHKTWNAKAIVALATCFIVGFSVEIIGVATGLIFGEYKYGAVLGPKLMGTPFMIGVNWAMLVYCAAATVHRITQFEYKPAIQTLVKSALGALLLTSLDVLIEPVAIYYDFWSWGGDGSIPLQNYVAWFIISFLLLIVFNSLVPKFKNKAALVLLILQFLFFFILGINW